MDMILFQFILAGAIASPLPPEHGRDGVGISGGLFPAPAVAACAADPGNGIPWPDLGGRDGLPVHVPAVNTENGKDGIASARHIDKSRSPGFLTMTGLHHVCCFHPAEPFKRLAKIVPRDIARQIPYIDIHSVPLFIGIEPLCFEGVLNKKK
jgi:hypothetical protein